MQVEAMSPAEVEQEQAKQERKVEAATQPTVITGSAMKLATLLRGECLAFMEHGGGSASDVLAVLTIMQGSFAQMIGIAMTKAEREAAKGRIAVATPEEAAAIRIAR